MAEHDDEHGEDHGEKPRDEQREEAVDVDDPAFDPRHDPELEEMADAIGDEGLADAVSEPGRVLPGTLLLPALTLTAAAAAPLHPDGYSFVQLLWVAFLRHPLEGLIMLLGFGAPFCFGALTAFASRHAGKGPATAAVLQRALVVNLSFLHAQMLLVAFLLWRDGIGMLPGSLLGLSVVSGGYFIYQHAQAAASDRGGLAMDWMIRWGATVIVALCGWIRLQLLVGVRLGWAVEVVLASCMAIAVLLTRSGAGFRSQG